MANSQANRITFPFKGTMNMNLNRAQIKTDVEFNEKNSAVIGGCLSPIWKKDNDDGINWKRCIYSQDGTRWSIGDDGKLYKNDTEVADSPIFDKSWKDEESNQKVLHYSVQGCSIYNDVTQSLIADDVTGFGTSSICTLKIWQDKDDDSQTHIVYENNEDYKGTYPNITEMSHETVINNTEGMIWAASWIPIRYTVKSGATDRYAYRPVVFSAKITSSNIELKVYVPKAFYERGDYKWRWLGEFDVIETKTLSVTDFDKGTNPFIECGCFADKATVDGTSYECGVVGLTIYSSQGVGLKKLDFLDFVWVGKFPTDEQSYTDYIPLANFTPSSTTITSTTTKPPRKLGFYRVNALMKYSAWSSYTRPEVVTNAVLVDLGQGDTGEYEATTNDRMQTGGLFANTVSITSGAVVIDLKQYFGTACIMNNVTVANSDTIRTVNYTLRPNYYKQYSFFQGTYGSGTYKSIAEAGRLHIDPLKPFIFSTTLENATDDYTIISDGFGDLREKTVNMMEKGQYASRWNYNDVIMMNGYYVGFSSRFGNLITEWNSIDTDFEPILCRPRINPNYYTDTNGLSHCENDVIYYRNIKGEYRKLSRTADVEIIDIVENRYILIRADAENNVYDMKSGKWHKWTPDWNNRLFYTNFEWTSSAYIGKLVIDNYQDVLSNTYNYGHNVTTKETVASVMASAVKPNYEIEENPFISTQFAPVVGIRSKYDEDTILSTNLSLYEDMARNVDVYFADSEESTLAVYKFTLRQMNEQTNRSILDGVTYPTGEIVYSPCLLSEFINSYNNRDYIKFGVNSYMLLYNNNNVIFGYTLASLVENIRAVFVIQTSTYYIIRNKIAYAQFNGNTLAGFTFLTDITGMEYVGSIPDFALFYSETDRQLYKFTGDAILSPFLDATVIKQYYSAFYCTPINSIIMAVKEYDNQEYVYIFQQDNLFKLEIGRPYRVGYNENERSIVFTLEDSTLMMGFTRTVGYEQDRVRIKTGFYGSGNEHISILSMWAIRLYHNDVVSGTDGEVLIRQNTITDKGTQTEEKRIKIAKSDWDKITDGFYFRFQPQYQRGVAFQLEVESDFPIQSITGEIAPDTTQIARHNI